MTFSRVTNTNLDNRYGNTAIHHDNKIQQAAFEKEEKKDEFVKPSLKAGVLASTVAGVGVVSAVIAKKQGFSLNPKVIFSQSPKDWAMFKIFNKKREGAKLMELEEPQILALAAGSVIGGLAGGAVFDDKKHLRGKFRETINQLLGNVLVPVICVGSVSRFYDRHKSKILANVPQAPGLGKGVNLLNKGLKAVPSCALTIAALGVGIVSGNKISNWINEKIYHKRVERKIKKTDFAPHVDDISMAVTLMADKNPLTTAITRTVPAFLCVPGYEIGTHRD